MAAITASRSPFARARGAQRRPASVPAAVSRRAAGAALAAALLGAVAPGAPARAATNPIVAENNLPGSPRSAWDLNRGASSAIEGFATQMSVDHGQTVQFKVKTSARSYRVDVYRLGYYAGAGARLVATLAPSAIPSQPAPLRNAATGLVDAGNWAVTASWAVPVSAVSGVYVAKLVRTDGTFGENHVPFVVRDDERRAAILLQTSDTTWQAYNTWGGNSLYAGSPAGRAYKVSYNRPFVNRFGDTTGTTGPRDFLFNSDYPVLRWLEANGYDVSYAAGADADRAGAELLEHRLYLSVGHDEYWSGPQRASVEAARDAGVNLAFFSGNEVFWKTRWEAGTDASRAAYRTLVCYKETHANAKIDPLDPPTWTGSWRDPRFSPPADGGRPENGLTGTIFMVNDGSLDRVTVPSAEGRMRFWRNTSVATLAPGAVATLTGDDLTYEWDEDLDDGARPAGLVRLSSTTDGSVQLLQDYGSTYGTGSATHAMTLYRAPSRALVFAAGAARYAWNLDDTHDVDPGTPVGVSPAADVRVQQATVNLLADMGIQPAASPLLPGLAAAAASTDATPPRSTITSPASGGTLTVGTPVTVAGTATDGGGGVVGGVEVSTDGATWHPAAGRGSWTYGWVPGAAGGVTIRSRAVDDSLNLEAPGAGVGVTVGGGSGGGGGGTTIFGASATPGTVTENDPAAVELGVKFRSSSGGSVAGVRFYKGPQNTGTHTATLWSAGGTVLATATFAGETAGGWQEVDFAQPVAIAAGQTYVASYHTAVGYYSVDANYFATSVANGPLTALADGVDGANGVYAYGPGGVFPTDTYLKSNYWVDVVLR